MKKNSGAQKDVRWDLSNIYKGLDSADFKKDCQRLGKLVAGAERYFSDNGIKKTEKTIKADKKTAEKASHAVEILNALYELYGTLDAFAASYYTTNSYDKLAAKTTSELEKMSVPLQNLGVAFSGFIGSIGKGLADLIKMDENLKKHEFSLIETYDQSKYLMSEAEETLASELSLSGGQAFSKLQGVVSSQLKVPVTIKGKTEAMPIASVRNLAYDTDEKIRKSAYEAELAGWESVKEPIAAALNGVKGHNITLNLHRKREDALHPSLDMNRIDRKSLEAMMAAMKASFPAFRKYFKKKALRSGRKSLPWWNLFAPAGKIDRRFTYNEACDFIIENFSTFSEELGDFAKHAFKNNWIDVYPRDGKRGGAFCMDVPGVGESRIMCNFDGSLDQVSTLAHELGHSLHNDCAVKAGKTELQKNTLKEIRFEPMV
ncbi:MAG TPA: M3 family metallopeptidase [Candidatus Wallbacteria bacterium]|nr:M3 family metallopeptidase [Candidatus Wallbacteria bacterium]